jgi:hypothetical protein
MKLIKLKAQLYDFLSSLRLQTSNIFPELGGYWIIGVPLPSAASFKTFPSLSHTYVATSD